MKNKKVIKKTFEFKNIFSTGFSISSKSFILKVKKNTEDCRFGLSISKKNFKRAVVRNKIKRQIRTFIKEVDEKKIHFIVVAKQNYDTKNYEATKQEFIELYSKIK